MEGKNRFHFTKQTETIEELFIISMYIYIYIALSCAGRDLLLPSILIFLDSKNRRAVSSTYMIVAHITVQDYILSTSEMMKDLGTYFCTHEANLLISVYMTVLSTNIIRISDHVTNCVYFLWLNSLNKVQIS